MYEFLCLFGPGVLSWLVSVRFCGQGEEKMAEGGILLAAARVISYALIDLTAVAAVCRPFGRIQFAVMPDGAFTVHYGVSALAAASVLAIVTGLCAAVASAYREKKAGHARQP